MVNRHSQNSELLAGKSLVSLACQTLDEDLGHQHRWTCRWHADMNLDEVSMSPCSSSTGLCRRHPGTCLTSLSCKSLDDSSGTTVLSGSLQGVQTPTGKFADRMFVFPEFLALPCTP